MPALEEKGLSCPDDISATGFNDMPFINRITQPLVTLHIPHYNLSIQSAQLLLERIREPEKTAKTVKLESKLIIRDSTILLPKEMVRRPIVGARASASIAQSND